uniref:Linkine n=1 Tax=Margaritifera margaritifera TaxID=102329 RepID=B5KFE5_PINMG|nr:linkine [Pinctada margaritifera]
MAFVKLPIVCLLILVFVLNFVEVKSSGKYKKDPVKRCGSKKPCTVTDPKDPSVQTVATCSTDNKAKTCPEGCFCPNIPRIPGVFGMDAYYCCKLKKRGYGQYYKKYSEGSK